MKNTCPNCGGAMELNICKYCGTMLVNLLDINLDESRQVWLQLRYGGNVVRMRANVNNMEITARPKMESYITMTGDTLRKITDTSVEVDCKFSGWLE